MSYRTIHANATKQFRLALRPDVEMTVAYHASIFPHDEPWEYWPAYSRAKRDVSNTCGWGSAPGDYDQRQFDLAMGEYLARTGL